MAVPIKEEAKGIFRIGPVKTGHPSASTSPYLVVGGQRAMVVEPGEDGQVAGLLEGIQQCGIARDRVEYVWASHIHLHHIQGLPQLLRELPKAKFLVHPRGAPHVVEPTRLVETTIQIWGDKCYGPFQGIPRERVMAVEDKQVIDLGGRELEIIYAPGHASHHMGLFDRQTRVLWPGDMDTGEGSFGRADGSSPTIFDVEKHIDSLRHYETFKPSMLLTFGRQHPMPAEQTLRDAQLDMLAIERLCREGMRQKVTLEELDKRVETFRDWTRAERWEAEGGRRVVRGAPAHMIAYVRRKNPDLEIPAGTRKVGLRAPK